MPTAGLSPFLTRTILCICKHLRPAFEMRLQSGTRLSSAIPRSSELEMNRSVVNDNTESVLKPGISIVESTDGTLACVRGPIDIDSSPAIREQLLALIKAKHTKIVSVDLSAVTHVDSAGLATLIEALKIARGNKTELKLQGLHDRLLHLFEFSGILSLFDSSLRGTSQSAGKAV